MTRLQREHDTPRRHLLIVAVAEYQPGWGPIRDGVEAEVRKAESLFLDRFAYERSTRLRLADTTQAGLKNGIVAWLERTPAGANDMAAVYYTGHGVVDRSIFRLVTSEVEARRPATSMTAADLIPLVWTGDRHVLLILDTCHSGAGSGEAMELLGRLREAEGGEARRFGLHVIATARPIEDAGTRAFVDALDQVVRDGSAAGSEDEFLRPDAVMEQVNRLLGSGRDRERQHAELSGRAEGLFRFFPNPAWDPRLRIGMPADTVSAVLDRIRRGALRSHWSPRARGVAVESEEGWLFTGRSKAMRTLVSWLSAAGGGAGLVVTGPPGAGKSALLARVVTLSDPAIRRQAEQAGALAGVVPAELPPPGLVTAAVHARRKTAADVALELAVALEADLASGETDPEAIARAAAVARDVAATVVVDALDEAQQPEQVVAFLRSIVERAAKVRLVVGLRGGEGASRLARGLGRRFERLDVGTAEYLRPADVRRYVERCLLAAPGSPFVGADAAPDMRKVARAVAARAGTSFLVASITARVLAQGDRTIASADLRDLPAEVGAAFAFDFQRFTLVEREEATAVFGALAFAQGRGLPRELWAPFATALGAASFDDEDVGRWLERAGYYVTRDTEQGRPVFRLYHEEFARFLRRQAAAAVAERSGTGVNPDELLAAALEATVPAAAGGARDWPEAMPYVRSYLVRYLRAAGRRRQLYELVLDPGWVAARTDGADRSPLLQDLDVAIQTAREETPPDVEAVARCCLAYARWMETAPPLIVDVMAAAGQRERAALVADNIAYPLDRCQAFALLAERNALVEPDLAREQFQAAQESALSVGGSYRQMTSYWLARAALALADDDTARLHARRALRRTQVLASRLRGTPLATEGWAADELLELAQDAAPDRLARAGAGDESGEETSENWMEVEHAIFWTAMALRLVADAPGLAEVRVLLAASRKRGYNLQLQTAAVAGDQDYLNGFLPWVGGRPDGPGGILRGNLALALVTAGRPDDAKRLLDETRDDWQNPGSVQLDAAKRLAWALALCGRYAEALAHTEAIPHPEERFRSLYRIAGVLQERGRRSELAAAADLAERLLLEEEKVLKRLERPPAALPTSSRRRTTARRSAKRARRLAKDESGRWQEFGVTDFWRLRTWAAWVLQAAGRTKRALELAELVTREEVSPAEARSLVRPTRVTELAKHHVPTRVAPSPDRQRMLAVFSLAAKGDVREATRLAATITLPRYRARARAAVAVKPADREPAIALWLSAVVDARRVGHRLVVEVLRRGGRLLGAAGRRALETWIEAAAEGHAPAGRGTPQQG